jgi:hypothetical protein
MHFFNPVACCFLYKAKDLSAPLVSVYRFWSYYMQMEGGNGIVDQRNSFFNYLLQTHTHTHKRKTRPVVSKINDMNMSLFKFCISLLYGLIYLFIYFFIYLLFIWWCWVDENSEFERMWKETIMAQFKLLTWNMPRGTEENHENSLSGEWPPCQNLQNKMQEC